MSETFGSVIDYVIDQLQGFHTDPPMYATLSQDVSDTTLILKLDLPAQSQPQGLVEIDRELVHVISYDPQTGQATVPAWGRGQQGTVKAAHTAGAKVSINPRYPRNRVALIVNQVIAGMCPPLFAVQTGEFTYADFQWEYPLPDSTRNLLRVEKRWSDSDVFDWRPVHTAFIKRDSGSPVLHVDACGDDRIRWTVAANPTAFTSETQPFTDCGLPESCIDIVSFGAIPRLISTVELARQQLTSVEVSERSTAIQVGSGTAAARFYMQMYQQRLDAEVSRLRQQYPLRQMRTF